MQDESNLHRNERGAMTKELERVDKQRKDDQPCSPNPNVCCYSRRQMRRMHTPPRDVGRLGRRKAQKSRERQPT